MRNIKLTLAYDGTEFHGWQIQPGQPTIQGVVSEALFRITQERITLHGAGRTDAGVHAWGQAANFETQSRLEPAQLFHALNALLPPAIRVRSAEEVSADFHARRSAEGKTYRYSIDRGAVISPFRYRYALHHPYPLDFDAMSKAARCFEGYRDFTTFAASTGSEEEDRERNVFRTIECSVMSASQAEAVGSTNALNPGRLDDGAEWNYLVRGKSFLRHMVRKMAGTLLEVGRGHLHPADIERLFELRDRSRSGPTAPPQGLCLVGVEYPAGAPTPINPEPDELQ